MHPYISNLKKILDRTGITSVYPSFLKEIECYNDYFSNHSLLTELGPHANGVFQTVINDQHNHRLFSLEWDINGILRDLDSTSIQAATDGCATLLPAWQPELMNCQKPAGTTPFRKRI